MSIATNFHLKGTQLSEIVIPNDVTDIKPYAFANFKSIKNFVLSNKLENIESFAFLNCSGIDSIFIPNSVQNVSSDSFDGLNYSCEIYTESNNLFLNTLNFNNIDRYCYGSDSDNYLLVRPNFTYDEYLVMENVNVRVSVLDENNRLKATLPTNVAYVLDESLMPKTRYQDDTGFYFQGWKAMKSNNSYIQDENTNGDKIYKPDDIVKFDEVVKLIPYYDNDNWDNNFNMPTSTFGFDEFGNDYWEIDDINCDNSYEDLNIPVLYNGCIIKSIHWTSDGNTGNGGSGGASGGGAISASILNIPGSITDFSVSDNMLDSINNINYYGINKNNINYYGNSINTLKNIYSSTYDYIFSNNQLAEYVGNGVNLTLPNLDSIGYYSIKENCFQNCNNLKSVLIPNNVLSIGDWVFYGCSNLASITIPNSITYIGNYAFYNCSKLTNITIPNSITSIGNYSFYNCSKLINITIPNSITSIGDNAFYNCTSLTTINLPDSITSVGNYAFYDCNSLSSINIPDSITNIGGWAFSECKSLNSITLPKNLKVVNNYLLAGCYNLKNIILPETITSIGYGAFSSCSSLTSIKIPKSINAINDSVFAGCYRLVEIVNNSSVLINNTKFGLTSNINSDLNVISDSNSSRIKVIDNDYIFFTDNSNITKLVEYKGSATSITLPTLENGQTYILRDDIFNEKHYGAINYNYKDLSSVILPNCVTSIGKSAFVSCTKLSSITFSNQLTEIKDYAFNNCSLLTGITIPKSVVSIGTSVFRGCTGLASIAVESGNTKYDSRDNCNAIIDTESDNLIYGCKNTTLPSTLLKIESYACSSMAVSGALTIPSGVKTIGEYAFNSSKITSLVIPKSVTSIGNSAFNSCSSLTSLTFESDSVLQTIGDSAFQSCYNLTTLVIPKSITSIGNSAFSSCSSLTSLTFESDSTLQTIGNNAFNSCNKITSLVIPNSITSIGNLAFYCCSSLTTLTFESDSVLQTIGNNAFSFCNQITSLIIPKSITSIGNSAFYSCSSLTTLTFESDSVLKTIGDSAFSYCNQITSLIIPKSITSIGSSAFNDCSSLTTLTFESESQLTDIGEKAFFSTKLESVIIPNSVTNIGNGAFSNISTLKTIDIVEGNSNYSVSDDKKYLFNSDKTTLYLALADDIPTTVTTIESYAYYGHTFNNVDITLENSITVNEYAFYDCSGINRFIIDYGNSTLNGRVYNNGYLYFKNASSLDYYNLQSLTDYSLPDRIYFYDESTVEDDSTDNTNLGYYYDRDSYNDENYEECDDDGNVVSAGTWYCYSRNSNY
jgi:hypothetical protein